MIIFIDPGKQGGYADFSEEGKIRSVGKLKIKKSKLGVEHFETLHIPEDTTRIYIEKQQPMGVIPGRSRAGGASRTDFKIGLLYGSLLQAVYGEAKKLKTPPVIIQVPIATWKAALKKETRTYPVLPSDTKALAEMYARQVLGSAAFEEYTILSKAQKLPHDGIVDALVLGLLYFQGYLDM